MPNQHKHKPVAYRPPAELRDWLLAFAKRSGRAVNAVITDALSEYRIAHDPQEGDGQK